LEAEGTVVSYPIRFQQLSTRHGFRAQTGVN
jgi:hypothetical protein